MKNIISKYCLLFICLCFILYISGTRNIQLSTEMLCKKSLCTICTIHNRCEENLPGQENLFSFFSQLYVSFVCVCVSVCVYCAIQWKYSVVFDIHTHTNTYSLDFKGLLNSFSKWKFYARAFNVVFIERVCVCVSVYGL